MGKKEAEELRAKILERRNYLKKIDTSVNYSKRNLYGGMQGRVARRADTNLKREVVSQRKVLDGNLKLVDNYLNQLSVRNASPCGQGKLKSQSASPDKAPVLPTIKLPLNPILMKSSNARMDKRGVGSRGAF